jgi:NADH:ubiquinone reductase (H+-translocating)
VTFLKDQGKCRALETTGAMVVKGVDDGSIFALGDCASIESKRTLNIITDALNKSESHKLNLDQFKELAGVCIKNYPQTETHFKNATELVL